MYEQIQSLAGSVSLETMKSVGILVGVLGGLWATKRAVGLVWLGTKLAGGLLGKGGASLVRGLMSAAQPIVVVPAIITAAASVAGFGVAELVYSPITTQQVGAAMVAGGVALLATIVTLARIAE